MSIKKQQNFNSADSLAYDSAGKFQTGWVVHCSLYYSIKISIPREIKISYFATDIITRLLHSTVLFVCHKLGGGDRTQKKKRNKAVYFQCV